MLMDKEIEINVNNRHISYYKNKGYNARGNKSLIIDINDLPENSHYKVRVKCDKCKIEKDIKYYNYFINIKNKNEYVCNNCKRKQVVYAK